MALSSHPASLGFWSGKRLHRAPTDSQLSLKALFNFCVWGLFNYCLTILFNFKFNPFFEVWSVSFSAADHKFIVQQRSVRLSLCPRPECRDIFCTKIDELCNACEFGIPSKLCNLIYTMYMPSNLSIKSFFILPFLGPWIPPSCWSTAATRGSSLPEVVQMVRKRHEVGALPASCQPSAREKQTQTPWPALLVPWPELQLRNPSISSWRSPLTPGSALQTLKSQTQKMGPWNTCNHWQSLVSSTEQIAKVGSILSRLFTGNRPVVPDEAWPGKPQEMAQGFTWSRTSAGLCGA